MVSKSITLLIAIEKIRIGTNRGRVNTLVIESLLLLEMVIDAVIEDIKTILRSESASKIFIEIKKDKLISKMIRIIGEKIKNKNIKFK